MKGSERTGASASARAWRRSQRRFRKRRLPCFAPHPPRSQWHPQTARTCFEGPFGEVLRATGPRAQVNHFRFSTKYQDEETGLIYYGERYYAANTAKWLTRDPIEEVGDLSLYVFVQNCPPNRHDFLGMISQVDSWSSWRCKLEAPFDLLDPAEYNDWGKCFHTNGSIFVNNSAEMISWLERATTPFNEYGISCDGCCVSLLGISGHGEYGMVWLSRDGSEGFSVLDEQKIKKFEDKGRPLPADLAKAKERNQRALEAFAKMNSRLCKKARIAVVQCGAEIPPGLPDAGLLRRRLEEIFGPGRAITTYTGNCGYKRGGRPCPLP